MTDFYQVKDRAYTTLASGLTDVALVAVYTSGGVFGSGNCIITCEDEKINQTVRSGNWATISRGFGGTTAAAHVIGTPVALNVTAGVIGQMQSGVYALESVSGAVNVGSLSGDVYALKGVSGTVYAHATTHLSGGADLLSGIALSSLGEAVAPAGCISIFVASATATAAEKALATSTYTCTGTNDHLIFQAALDAGAKNIYATQGAYSFAAKLLYKAHNQVIHFGGAARDAGQGSTITLAAASNCTILGTDGTTYNNCGIYNVTIDGNKANQGAGNWDGIDITNLQYFHAQRVDVVGCKRHGWYSSGATYPLNPVLTDCWGNTCAGDGFHLSILNAPTFFNLLAIGNTLNGYDIGCTDGVLLGIGADVNGQYGFQHGGVRNRISLEIGTDTLWAAYLNDMDDCIVDIRCIRPVGYDARAAYAIYMNGCDANSINMMLNDVVSGLGIAMNNCQRNVMVGTVTMPLAASTYGLLNMSGSSCKNRFFVNWDTDGYSLDIGAGSNNNTFIGGIRGTMVNLGTNNKFTLDGYIAPGEIRTASGALTAGNANAFAFAWQNPEAQAIWAQIMVEITTAGGTAGALLDAGSGASATTASDNMIDGADLNATNLLVSSAWVKLDANGGATDWITGQILVQNAASLAGRYFIKYIGAA